MLENGYTAVHLREVGDLSVAKDLPAMRALLSPTMPDKSEKAVGNYAAQLNAFANRMSVGDIVGLRSRASASLPSASSRAHTNTCLDTADGPRPALAPPSRSQ
jgi:restriction system protein